MDCYDINCKYRFNTTSQSKLECSNSWCPDRDQFPKYDGFGEIRFRRCGTAWHYCDGKCGDCENFKYDIDNTTGKPAFEDVKVVDYFSDLAEQEKELADWKVEVEMKLFHLNEEIIRLKNMVESNDYKSKD